MTRERAMAVAPPLHPMLGIAFLNFIFVVLTLIVFFSLFAVPSGFDIHVPMAAENALEENRATVRITGENVLYFNDKVVTLNDLKRALLKLNGAATVIYLRIDRRASTGRTVDVLDICKAFGIARVNVVAL